MRYFIVQYIKTPNGSMDEIVSVSKKVKTRDYQVASVILDFREQRVLLASLDGTVVPRDWTRIRDFYYQHYKNLIDQLESQNVKAGVPEVLPTPEPAQ